MNIQNLSNQAQQIVEEEIKLLALVRQGLLAQSVPEQTSGVYNDIIELRNSINEARTEDMPTIIADMERLILLTQQQEKLNTVQLINSQSPYFGHIKIREKTRIRNLLIGEQNCFSSHLPCPVVDWKSAPISILYYRYREEDDYYEEIGERLMEGVMLARRTLLFRNGELRRITSKDYDIICDDAGEWNEIQEQHAVLHGGSGTAIRAVSAVKKSQKISVDRHLHQITALLDPHQYDIITQPKDGVILIQGGAGSGKTTVALHRLAYLLAQYPQSFFPEHVMCMVFNTAIANYISTFFPALGIQGIKTWTYQHWASSFRKRFFQELPHVYSQNTPVNVIVFKKHPFLIHWFKELIQRRESGFLEDVRENLSKFQETEQAFQLWARVDKEPLIDKVLYLKAWLEKKSRFSDIPPCENYVFQKRMLSMLDNWFPGTESPVQLVVQLWEDAFIHKDTLQEACQRWIPGVFSDQQLTEIVMWAVRNYQKRQASKGDVNLDPDAVDLRLFVDDEPACLDDEDDTLLLFLYLLIMGPFRGKQQKRIMFHHLLVDEVQDFSPMELQVLVSMTPDQQKSITFAGDMDQQVATGSAWSNWDELFKYVDLQVKQLTPLKIGYRSTHEIMNVAREVIGPYSVNEEWQAYRHGEPVSLFSFQTTGHLIGWLCETLFDLMIREPGASVAVLTRNPDYADKIFMGLQMADIPHLRRIVDQEFTFTPGIEVTDIKQVKGLEFDYVLLVDADSGTYGIDVKSRNFMYVGATRAAHQLWLAHIGKPAPLLPLEILSR
ncbi:MAG: AAA family ATPase [SAR324 cluster bacterium]|nr:AAA family ATPase [SAR324 cluster bacterium]